MKREEAKRILNRVLEEWVIDDDISIPREEALRFAIKVLEQEPISCQSCKHLNEDTEICLECEYDGTTRGMTRFEKQESCEDAISRQEAIKSMNDLEQEDIEQYGCSIPEGFDGKRAIEALQSLPSFTPKQKMGHWVPTDKTWVGINECSICGYRKDVHHKMDFCPSCGADMRGEE